MNFFCIFLSLYSVVCIKISAYDLQDDYLNKALNLIEDDSNDLETIFHCLENSQSPESEAILAEQFLIGSQTKRNFNSSLVYLKEAYNKGSADACFYLYAILFQSQIFEISGIEAPLDPVKVLQKLYKTGLARGSILMKTLAVSNYFLCKSSFKSRLTDQANFLQMDCSEDIEKVGQYALEISETAIRKVILSGRVFASPSALDSDQLTSENLAEYVVKALDKEESNSLSILAENFLFGNPDLGIARNLSRSVDLFKKAAEGKSVEAIESLSVMAIRGLGLNTNYSEAADLLVEGMNQGSTRSLSTAAYMFLHDWHFEKNEQKAIEFFELAAEKGDYEALNNLALIYMKNDQKPLALELLKLSAEAGYAPARHNLGIAYLEGKLVKKQIDEAIQNFWKVMQEGPLTRFSRVGLSLFRKKDFTGAFWAYSFSSLLGFVDATKSLSFLVKNLSGGYPCRKHNDYCFALYSLNLARLKVEEGYKNLAKISMKENTFVEKNCTEAYRLFKMSENQGESMYFLGYLEEIGCGVQQNVSAAILAYENIIAKTIKHQLPDEEYFPAILAWLRATLKLFFGKLLN